MTSARFPRSARVRARSDFDRIFQHGRRVALPVLALHWQASDVPARLGLAVSRKVDPHAVGRNRIKRVLRDTFRHLRDQLAAGDYVVVARPAARAASGPELVAAFQGLLQRSGALTPAALPLSPAPGTMPAASPSAPAPHVDRG
ncbi:MULTISPECIES: ribonuclease P protein component [unclassified Lysobacter]|uniref:ribonuclease P protein component n=1 Tax=unclassified Lysobacter TaxID=2635362 RepID=UPI001C23903F|nr:ribonuclease P protein component [Lysobacter sp. MMG2]MBU8977176.1 ribonuclease P protein component [Lysobacter sp. MMG2]